MMQKPPGRPPLDSSDDSVPVCLTLTARQYDELDARAKRERVSVPEVIRRELRIAAEIKYKK